MWKVLNKEVDLGEPTSFFDHVYLGCTQRQCEISKDSVDNYRTTFESRIAAGGLEKLPFPQNISISSWSYDMAGHAKKCVERYCELANKTTQQLYKVSTPCIDDHHFKEEETKSVGELSNTCSQIVLKCLYLARIGRLDILWSVNKLARSITKWTKACDKRLNRLISYIHHTCEYKQYCHVGNTAKQCRLGLFQDFDFAGDVDIDEPTSFLDHVYFGMYSAWLQTEWNNNWTVQEDVWITYFCWSNRKLLGWWKPHAQTVAWSYDMEGHAQKCVERYCELANNTVEQLYKVSSPCLDDH